MHPAQSPSTAKALMAIGLRFLPVSFEMAVPAMLGYWIDRKWGTECFAFPGVVLGFIAGLCHLVVLANASVRDMNRRSNDDDADTD